MEALSPDHGRGSARPLAQGRGRRGRRTATCSPRSRPTRPPWSWSRGATASSGRSSCRRGGTAAVGAVIAVIAAGGRGHLGRGRRRREARRCGRSRGGRSRAETPPRRRAPLPPLRLRPPRPPRSPRATGGRVKASPVARRLADESGSRHLSRRGLRSGRAGREARRRGGQGRQAWPARRRGALDARRAPSTRTFRSRRCGRPSPSGWSPSIGPVPTFYLTIDVDMARVHRGAEEHQRAAGDGGPEGLDQRHRPEGDGRRARPAPRVQRAVARRLHPTVPRGAPGRGGRDRRRADHAGGEATRT